MGGTPLIEDSSSLAAAGKVLVADDDDDTRRIIAERLREEGFDVVEAATGSEAVARCAAGTVDVAVLDVLMPGLNGFEALDRIARRGAAPAVLFTTALNSTDDRARGLHGGAVSYITKPFSLEDLVAGVAAAAKHHTVVREEIRREREDLLTGLPNGRVFQWVIEMEAKRSARYRNPLALALFEVEGVGHDSAGRGCHRDAGLLRVFAGCLRETCRETDWVFRIEYNIFAALFLECTRHESSKIMARLHRSIGDAAKREEEGAHLEGVTAGLGFLPLDGSDAAGLYRAAERSLCLARMSHPREVPHEELCAET